MEKPFAVGGKTLCCGFTPPARPCSPLGVCYVSATYDPPLPPRPPPFSCGALRPHTETQRARASLLLCKHTCPFFPLETSQNMAALIPSLPPRAPRPGGPPGSGTPGAAAVAAVHLHQEGAPWMSPSGRASGRAPPRGAPRRGRCTRREEARGRVVGVVGEAAAVSPPLLLLRPAGSGSRGAARGRVGAGQQQAAAATAAPRPRPPPPPPPPARHSGPVRGGAGRAGAAGARWALLPRPPAAALSPQTPGRRAGPRRRPPGCEKRPAGPRRPA